MIKTKSRLTGIDLFRCLAIFGVIILHSDQGISFESQGWPQILEFSHFAVPFFLATSFYLAFNKIYVTGGEYLLRPRLTRLLIPYLLWTGIYVSYKSFKYLIQHEPDNLNKLFHDPIGIIFFGGAAFHLYFLPLLISGTLFIQLIIWLQNKKISLKNLILLCFISLVLYQVILQTGNSFDNRTALAFQSLLSSPFFGNLENNSLLRILLVGLALLIRCLPYIFMAAIITHQNVNWQWQRNSSKYFMIILVSFLIINSFGRALLPESLSELSRGYTALLLAIVLSNYLPQNKIVKNLSFCSFGIYLIHLLFVEFFQIIETRIYPGGLFRVSTPNLLLFAIIVLATSWMTTDFIMKKKWLAKLIFGI